jgi:hypothetical protein
MWLAEAERRENPDSEKWDKVVELVQTAFRDGTLPTEMVWQTIVLISKGSGGFRGVGLVEVLWKVGEIILDTRLGAIEFHDVLHGF